MRLVRYSHSPFRTVQPAFAGLSRSPWSAFETEIGRLFETAQFSPTSLNRFPLDLYQDELNVYVRAELPGVSRDDINVEMTDGTLTISAVRKTPTNDGKSGEPLSLNRAVSIADDIQSANVTAAFVDGILTVTLPKREEAKPKKVNIAVK